MRIVTHVPASEVKVRQEKRAAWSPRRIRLWFILPLVSVLLYMIGYHAFDHGSDNLRNFDHSILLRNSLPIGSVALILVAHDRPDYFRDCLASIFVARGIEKVDIIVSMDYPANFASLLSVVDEFSTPEHPIRIWKNVLPFGQILHTSDDRITYHHGQILERAFGYAQYDYAIILETDLVVSADFFEFMFNSGHLLAKPVENNLMCISGWNDNGMEYFNLDESRLFRTDFFPGLGWMTHRSVWTDILRAEWPSRFGFNSYDVWLRTKASTRSMDCLVPEVPRTHHIAKYGSSVSGRSYTWYDAMRLASGKVGISVGEIGLVGAGSANFENRVRKERLAHAKIVTPESLKAIPFQSSIIVVVADERAMMSKEMEWLWYGGEATMVANDVRSVNLMLRLFYYQFRSSHKGMMTVSLNKQKYGGTNVTLIAERARDFWLGEEEWQKKQQ